MNNIKVNSRSMAIAIPQPPSPEILAKILQEVTDHKVGGTQKIYAKQIYDLLRAPRSMRAIQLAIEAFNILKNIGGLEGNGIKSLPGDTWRVYHTKLEGFNKNGVFEMNNGILSHNIAGISETATNKSLMIKLYVTKDGEIAAIGKIDDTNGNLMPVDRGDEAFLDNFLNKVAPDVQIPEEDQKRGYR